MAGTKYHWQVGAKDPEAINPDNWVPDQALLDRPGNQDCQVDLLEDYKSNIALYPDFHEYFRQYKPPFLAVWGKNDPFFLPPGAEAFKRDIPNADVLFFDTGLFALETHAAPIASAIREFLS